MFLCAGRPNPAIFVSDPRGKYRDMYNISWNVNSYTPIEEFKLSFRKLQVSSLDTPPGHQQPPPPQQQLQPPPNNRRQSRKVSSRHCPRPTRTYSTLKTWVKSLISRLTSRRKHIDPVKNISFCHRIYQFPVVTVY